MNSALLFFIKLFCIYNVHYNSMSASIERWPIQLIFETYSSCISQKHISNEPSIKIELTLASQN